MGLLPGASIWTQIDFEAKNGVVNNGIHDCDVQEVVLAEASVLEELHAEGVLLRLRLPGVNLEGLLESYSRNAHLLRKVVTGHEVLHQTASTVMLAVPLDLFRRRTVEDKADRVL